jgi:lysylphosphatidylglycerol synthetase-like protein (DUF2156 family)
VIPELAIIGVVAGAVVGRYKVMILVPTIVLSVLLVVAVGAALAYSLSSIIQIVVIVVVAVQGAIWLESRYGRQRSASRLRWNGNDWGRVLQLELEQGEREAA